jgi:hypothetical protein
MANLTRKQQKVFAQDALNNGQFGSLQLGTKITTTDTDVIQALGAFLEGWNDAVVSGEELPALEEFQALHFLTTRQISYLLDKGIPEWEVNSEYFIGDIQREVGGTKLYRSITDNNIGNVLTDVVNWVLLVDLADISPATTTTTGTSILPQQITVANGTDTDHDIDFGAGVFQFDDGSGQAVVSALTKQIDAVWAAGDNVGGLDTGTVAIDTTYHLFAIYNPTTETSDFLFSASVSSPTLPSGYTKKKRIAALITDGSANILNGTYTFSKDGTYNFKYLVGINDVNSINPGTGAILSSVSVPTGTSVRWNGVFLVFDGSASFDTYYLITSIGDTDSVPTESLSHIRTESAAGGNTAGSIYPDDIYTNTSSQVRYRISASTTGHQVILTTFGWTEKNI